MRWRRLVVALAAITLALGSLAFWMLPSGSSEAEPGAMHNCAPAGKWSIAVWDGESGTSPADALSTCGAGAVDAAYSLDPQTQAWTRWFADRPQLNNLPPLSDVQGLLALGSAAGPSLATATPSPTATASPTATPPAPTPVPALAVEVTAKDDEVRDTGVMVLCPGGPPPPAGAGVADADTCNDSGDDIWQDLHAGYELTITLDGAPTEATVACMVTQEEIVSPSDPMAAFEDFRTELTDVSADFVCVIRTVAPGVGTLDLYYVGPDDAAAVGSYDLAVEAFVHIGTDVIFATDTQHVCMLGWPFNDNGANMTFAVDASTPDGLKHVKRAPHPLDGFAGCGDAALYQRQLLGLSIP
jgi:hypothetical protein